MFVNELKKAERRDICFKCPFRKKDFKILGIRIFKTLSQCNICKCSIVAKTSLKDAKCPLDKW